jgi:hypothetical protein
MVTEKVAAAAEAQTAAAGGRRAGVQRVSVSDYGKAIENISKLNDSTVVHLKKPIAKSLLRWRRP